MGKMDDFIDPYKPVERRVEEIKEDAGPDFDPINPDYYRRFGDFEVNDLTKHLSFNLGNVVKYSSRAGFKGGTDAIQDLKKAKWYLESEIDRLG